MSAREDLNQLGDLDSFDPSSATCEQLVARLETLEALYKAHPAQRVLEELHRYLYPERYGAVALHEWDAGTIIDVADRIERALSDPPAATADFADRAHKR